jgi:hypothetical protein
MGQRQGTVRWDVHLLTTESRGDDSSSFLKDENSIKNDIGTKEQNSILKKIFLLWKYLVGLKIRIIGC